tara:strand:+ start:804 stop:992 length:189 start_codon:yes stop_codon:yes gene_type:complete
LDYFTNYVPLVIAVPIFIIFDKNNYYGKESRCKKEYKKGTGFICQGKESGKKGQESQKILMG